MLNNIVFEELSSEGILTDPKYVKEIRPGQVKMANIVAKCLEDGTNAIIEAGTGVGKTFAYLLPSILWGSQVVVSSSTKALQDQILNTDLPYLQKILAEKNCKFTFVSVKGTSNYVCARLVRSSGEPFSKRFLKWVDASLKGENTGELAEYEKLDKEPVKVYDCTAEYCTRCALSSRCRYAHSREAAKNANILVVNHHLLSLSLRFHSPLIKNASAFVLDEAHKAPNAFRAALSLSTTPGALRSLVNKISHMDIQLPAIKALNTTLAELAVDYASIVELVPPTKDKSYRLTVNQWGDAAKHYKARVQALIEKSHHVIEAFLKPAKDMAKELEAKSVEELDPDLVQGALTCEKMGIKLHEKILMLQSIYDFAEDTSSTVECICVVNESSLGEVQVEIVPLNADSLLKSVQISKQPVIITSATLDTGDKMQTIKHSLGLVHNRNYLAQIGSAFDVHNNSIAYVPRASCVKPLNYNGNENEERSHYVAICREVVSIYQLVEGNVLILFRSKDALTKVLDILMRVKQKKKLGPIYAQTGDETPAQLTKQYIADCEAGNKPMLLGLNSFWEGVSLNGDLVRAVIMTKLPFPAPDPVTDALQKKTANGFAEIVLPAMLLDLKQGQGRLLRTNTDKGIVALLDSRAIDKGYVRKVRACLPKRVVRDWRELEFAWENHREKGFLRSVETS